MEHIETLLPKVENQNMLKPPIGEMTLTISRKSVQMSGLDKYGIFERYSHVTFEEIERNGHPSDAAWLKSYKGVVNYAEQLDWHMKNGTGLILKGPVGTGKTTLAVAVLREAIRKGYSGYFIPMVSLLDNILTLRDAEEKRRFEDRIRRASLLVLDDLGAEYDKGWVLAKVDAIITERYNRRKSTIITTNLSITGTGDTLGARYNARILDRLRSTSKVVSFVGRSLREEEWKPCQ